MEDFQLRPAHDLGLTVSQRQLSIVREPGLFSTTGQLAWWTMIKAYLSTYHRLGVEGRENLPAQPPCLLIANHSSHLDAMVLASVLPTAWRSHTFPIAAADTFFQTPTTRLFSTVCLNALPMWRRNRGRHVLAQLKHRLISEPCCYILFPEGTRSRDGRLGAFKAGMGMLVAQTCVSVVPCRLSGAFEAMPPDARLPRPRTLQLRIGAPLRFDDVADNRAGWTQVSDACHAAVAALA